ncbi:MAG: TatD family hydrolase [Clostridia bacterium]|nr:TatD family hydrolase [Clostridia bacterium]
MLRLFDSHAHYNDARFENEFEGGADALLSELFAGEVGTIINVATNMADAESVIKTAAKYEGMYVAVGIHPTDAQECADIEAELSALDALLAERKKHKIVALGEIGLDYYWQPVDKQLQAYVLREQMKLAQKYSLPVVIHDREAHGDCFDMVLEHPEVRGVFHSYSGSAEMAKELVRRGWYISFSGVVTFKNADRVRAVAATVPTDRLLVETDAPYLAPHPHRGKLNHSGLMIHTVETLAGLFDMTPEDMARLTRNNAGRLFGL